MSWLSTLLGKTVTQQFVSLIISAAKLFLGKLAKEVYAIVQHEVVKAEAKGGKAWDKWEAAYDGIRARVKQDIPEFILSILIEAAVAEIKSLKK